MREMQWSWRELQDTPADLVDEIAERIAARQAAEAMKRKQDGA
jgi:hypothetical protein